MKRALRRMALWLEQQGYRVQARRALRRECGPCRLCCTVRGVDTFGKPPGVPCDELAVRRGCGIYHARPDECRNYLCGWRMGFLGPELRPDRTGVVFDLVFEDAPVIGWTVRPGPLATPESVLEVAEALLEEDPRYLGIVPFGLAGGEQIMSCRPGSLELKELLEGVAAGTTSLLAGELPEAAMAIVCDDPECGHPLQEHDNVSGCQHEAPDGDLCSCGRSQAEVIAAAAEGR